MEKSISNKKISKSIVLVIIALFTFSILSVALCNTYASAVSGFDEVEKGDFNISIENGILTITNFTEKVWQEHDSIELLLTDNLNAETIKDFNYDSSFPDGDAEHCKLISFGKYGDLIKPNENNMVKINLWDYLDNNKYDYGGKNIYSSDMVIGKKYNFILFVFGQGQSELCSNTVTACYKSLPLPEEPTMEGHTFAGWYYDNEYTKPYNVGDVITEDTNLYAKFTINTYTLTFKAFGEDVDAVDVVYGDMCPANEDGALDRPYSKTGYKFEGWYLDQAYMSAWDFDKPIEKDMTLYAKMTPVMCKVTFYIGNTNKIYKEFEVPYGTTLIECEEIKKCKSFFNEPKLININGELKKLDSDFVVTEPTTLCANFKKGIDGWNNFGMWWVNNWYWVLIGLIGAIVIVVLCVVMYKRA